MIDLYKQVEVVVRRGTGECSERAMVYPVDLAAELRKNGLAGPARKAMLYFTQEDEYCQCPADLFGFLVRPKAVRQVPKVTWSGALLDVDLGDWGSVMVSPASFNDHVVPLLGLEPVEEPQQTGSYIDKKH